MEWLSWCVGITQKNNFEVLIYEEDYRELCAYVLMKPEIETGGDLFGLWLDEHRAVIQVALGPGKGCRRTTTSFYQDVNYLAKVGSYLTEKEGLCHIGEWHSHHQLGLAKPSSGDERTVWNNMPTYQFSRFVLFIANIEAYDQTFKVNFRCFLFKIDNNGYQFPVLPGELRILHSENPFSQKNEVRLERVNGAEIQTEIRDETNIDTKDLELGKEYSGRPFVIMQKRNFEVLIYEEDYKEMCAHVLRKPNIETGGDLFGLWQDERKAVVQLALGPGKGCRRTSTSFYQDVEYLAKVGSYLTEKEGVCHIGEWHSHHQLGLARPSGGDEGTVWRNMPTYQLSRFVIFIANIEATGQGYKVNIGCFLFEIDGKGNRLPVKQGRFKILPSKNPFWLKKDIHQQRKNGAENSKGDSFDVVIADLKLEKGEKSPSVTMQRSRSKRHNFCEDDYDTPPPKKGNNYGRRAPGSNKRTERNGRSQTHQQLKDVHKQQNHEEDDAPDPDNGEMQEDEAADASKDVHKQQNHEENDAPDSDNGEMQEDETADASKSLGGGKQEKNERGGMVKSDIISGGNKQLGMSKCDKQGESSEPSKVIQKTDLGKAEIPDGGQQKEDDVEMQKDETADASKSLGGGKQEKNERGEMVKSSITSGGTKQLGMSKCDKQGESSEPSKVIQKTDLGKAEIPDGGQQKEDDVEMQKDETADASKSLGGGKQEKNERGGMVKSAITSGGTKQLGMSKCDKQGESSEPSKVIQKTDLGKAEIPDGGQQKEDDVSRGSSLLQGKEKEEGRIRDEVQQDAKETDQNKDGMEDENKEGPLKEELKTDNPDAQKNETGCPSSVTSQPQADQQHAMVPEDQNKRGNDEEDSAQEDKMETAEGQDEGKNTKDQDHSTNGSSQDQRKDMKGDSKKVKENNPRPGISEGKTSKEKKKKSTEKDKAERKTSKGTAGKANGEPVSKKTGSGATSEKKNGATQPKTTAKKPSPAPKARTTRKR